MLKFIKKTLNAYLQKKSFDSLDDSWHNIVFYAESIADWPHFENIIRDLISHKQKICYIHSDDFPPDEFSKSEYFKSFFIGSGTIRTLLFRTIKAKIFVMTLPDIETFHLKRSVSKVHYVYVFHSINSTHMVYRKGAFDAYDTIFCVGKHHIEEIRANESKYNLTGKHLVEHGYARLDNLIGHQNEAYVNKEQLEKVLIAPSWGRGSIAESHFFVELISTIINHDIFVTVRLHPMTIRHYPHLVDDLNKKFTGDNFLIDINMGNMQSLFNSDILITDWSGASYEFAFSTKRPVLFIDTPKKINNEDYKVIEKIPLEDSIRNEIGCVLETDKIEEVVTKLNQLFDKKSLYKDKIENSMKNSVYNIGNSGEVGAKEIIRLSQTV